MTNEPFTAVHQGDRRRRRYRILAALVTVGALGVGYHFVVADGPSITTCRDYGPNNCYDLINKNPALGGLPSTVAQLNPVQKAGLEGELRRGEPIDPWARTLEKALRQDMATSSTTG